MKRKLANKKSAYTFQKKSENKIAHMRRMPFIWFKTHENERIDFFHILTCFAVNVMQMGNQRNRLNPNFGHIKRIKFQLVQK